MNNLSVAIIAKNEAPVISRCLSSAKQVTSDIVVLVDAESTDETEKIASRYGAKVFHQKFSDFASQKNLAAEKTAHDWVLFLDADEWFSNDLVSELVQLRPIHNAYSLPRINHIFGKEIRFTGWAPENDRHIWLYRKSKGKWAGAVHEHVEISGSVGKLKGPKIHENYRTVEQFVSKLNQYTTIAASEKTKSPHLLILYPVWKFIRHFVIQSGYRDGIHGLYLSYLMAIYGLTYSVKTWVKKSGS